MKLLVNVVLPVRPPQAEQQLLQEVRVLGIIVLQEEQWLTILGLYPAIVKKIVKEGEQWQKNALKWEYW